MTFGLTRMALGVVLLAAAALAPNAAFAQSDAHQWSGAYIGAQAIGTNDHVNASAPLLVTQISNLFQNNRGLIVVPGFTSAFAASKSRTSAIAGGFAGYQFSAGGLILGVEGDYAPIRRSVSLSQTAAVPSTALTPVAAIAERRDVQLNGQWTARLRAGYAAGATLFYATGGYARTRGRVTSTDSFTNPGGLAAIGVCGANNTPCQFNSGPEGPVVTTASESRSLTGWTAGAGIEHKLGRSLSIGLEFRHTALGTRAFTLANQTIVNTGPATVGDNGQGGLLGSVSTGPTQVRLRTEAVNVRVAFHF